MLRGGRRLFGGVRLVDAPCLAVAERLDRMCMPLVASMQRTGMQIDPDHFTAMSRELTDDMDRITEDVHRITGHYINIDSSDQVADLLFKKLKLKQARPKFTRSGDRESTADDVLTAIQHEHEVIPKIQEFKEYSKLKGTYVEPIPKLAIRVAFGEYRLFPRLTQTRIPSARFAARDPNLLAIPTRTKKGRRVRLGFPARRGYRYVSGDMSQIEPRVATHRSKDPELLKVYREGHDIYSDFALAAFKIPDQRYKNDKGKWIYPGVDADEHRRPCKTCVLAALYRVTAVGLLEQMPVVCATCNKEATEHDCGNFKSYWHENNCQTLLSSFFMKYSGLVRQMKVDDQRAMKYGYGWDMFGRILHVAAVYSKHKWIVSKTLREMGNFPNQSGAGGCLKLVMGIIQQDIEENGLRELVYPLLPVHDELIFEVREDITEEFGELLTYRFETCCDIDVPIKAGIAVADRWGELEK